MSAAQSRPFRHTATVVSLAITTALAEIGRDLLNASAKSLRHSESERKNKKLNKGRVSALQEEAKTAKDRQELLETFVTDWFDTIYIHRYRDIDPKIRVDCVLAMGDWIVAYPEHFFDGSHLRYLGWILSDSHAPARHEVVRQLHRLYREKDRLAGLKMFTERFRGRLVEMATRDSDPGVRASTVELLDLLRDAGFLEPDDIDAVGRLVFDAEPRVRKAVVGFFAESVNDAYESKIEDLGGKEAVEEQFPDDTSSSEPGLDWLKLKCLAEMLESYDEAEGAIPDNAQPVPGRDEYQLFASTLESRFIVAAESLYSQMPVIQEWETLAEYLLCDMSDAGQNGVSDDPVVQLKGLAKLNEREEMILLEVLNASVRGEVAHLVDAASEKKGKKTKKQREELAAEQESTARQFVNLIPRLLKRFGDVPQTASIVLRLERLVGLDAFQDYNQDTTTYTAILEDINRQFLTHGSEEVLTEASRALLRAQDHHEFDEVTTEKIEELWEGTLSTFVSLVGTHDLAVRGSIPPNVLDTLAKTVSRIERLSMISRPLEHLETAPSTSSSGRKSKATQKQAPIESLLALIQRAIPDATNTEDPDDGTLEDHIALHSARAVSFYFLWSISEMKTALESPAGLPDERLEALAAHRDAFVTALLSVVEARPKDDDVTISMAGILLDAHTLMATLRQVKPHERTREDYLALAMDMDKPVQKWILAAFGATEQSFAKLTSRQLDKVADDKVEDDDVNADPIDEDPVSDIDDMDGDDDDNGEMNGVDGESSQQRNKDKQRRQIVAEERLCVLTAKIVLAVLGGVMDSTATRKRIERNKTKLGHNFKEVLKHLELEKTGKGTKKVAAKAKAKKAPAPQSKKSEEMVIDGDDEDEQDDEDDEEALRRKGLLDEEDDVVENGNDEEPEAEAESVLGD